MARSGGLVRVISGVAFAAIALVIGAVVFLLIWLTISPISPFFALIVIGLLALLLAAGSYFAQAFVAQPILARAASWGFLAMGFTVLFVTDGLYVDGAIGMVLRLYLALLFLAFLAISVGGIYWRSTQLAAQERRTEARKEWASQPATSAFDYAGAQAPNVPPPNSPNAVAPATRPK